MYKGKHVSVKKYRKTSVLLVSLMVLLLTAAMTTLAFLATDTEPVTNTFLVAAVPNSVQEDPFDGEVKTNVKIQNDGNTQAYIRAAVVVNWVDEQGNIAPDPPEAGRDYQITWGESGWFAKDGYHYYKAPVGYKSGAEGQPLTEYQTSVLISKCEPLVRKDGYHLSVEIVAQSIQANGVNSEGKKPVVLAWGLDPEDLQ